MLCYSNVVFSTKELQQDYAEKIGKIIETPEIGYITAAAVSILFCRYSKYGGVIALPENIDFAHFLSVLSSKNAYDIAIEKYASSHRVTGSTERIKQAVKE